MINPSKPININSREFLGDRYAHYDQIREEQPVCLRQSKRHDDVRRVAL